jgi:hypothetical protein
MTEGLRLTPEGAKALRDDTALEPKHRLMLEAMKSFAKPVPMEVLIDVCNRLIAECDGDVERAILGLKTGNIKLTWEPT